MDFFGKWVVKDVMVFGEEGMEYKSVDRIKGTDYEEMYTEILDTVVVISAEKLDTYVKIPEDQVMEAVAEGIPVTEYGILAQSCEVKEENGEYFYDSRTEGEADGEEVSPFVRLELDENGLLPFGEGMFRLQKVD